MSSVRVLIFAEIGSEKWATQFDTHFSWVACSKELTASQFLHTACGLNIPEHTRYYGDTRVSSFDLAGPVI
jgi:hypothetical protein